MVNFGFGIDIIYNPGNALTGLNQLNNVLLQSRTAAQSFAAGFAGIGGGLSNFEAPINRAGTAITLYKEQVTAIVPINTQAATSINRLVTTFTSAGQAIAGSARLMTPFNAAVTQLGNTAQTTATKFSAGLAPAVAAVGGPLNSFGSQLGTASSGLNNLSVSGGNATTALGRLRELFSGNRGLVFGASALFGTLTGIAFELQLVGDANKQVGESQAVVNGLIAAGKEGTAQYSQAVQALGKDQRFLEFSSRNLALAFTNLIPDVLLIINGFIQLSAKFQTTGTAAQALSTGLTATQTAMTTTTTATTTLNAAQTTLGTGFVTSSNAMKSMIPVLAGTRAEQAGLVLTSNGLAVSQEAVAAKTVLSRDALRGLQGVIALTRAEEIGLIATNDALGASFLNVGKGAAAGGGGIKGLLANLLGLGAGGGLKGILGAIGGVALPIAGAIGFVAFADQFAKSATSVVNSRLLAEKALEDANRKQSDDIIRLSDTVGSGATQIAGHWSTLASNVTASADKIISKQNEIAGKGGPGPAGSGQASFWEQQGKQDFSGGTSTAAGNVLDIAQGKTGGPLGQLGSNFSNQITPPQLREWQKRQAANAVARNPAAGMNGVIVDQFTSPFGFYGQPIGGVGVQRPMTQEAEFQNFINETNKAGGLISASDTTKKVLPDFAGKRVVGGMDLNMLTQMLKAEDDISAKEADIEQKRQAKTLSPADVAELQLLKEKSAELLVNKDALDKTKDSQDLITKTIENASAAMHKHNEAVLAMPSALAAATGQELEMSRVIQTSLGPAVARDTELDKHIALIAQQSAAYTNVNTAQSLNLKTQEELVKIGNAVVGGVEEELTHVTALNAFWGNLSTTMKDNILTNQQLTLASVDVTASLTNQAQHQFLVNEGLIAGKEAAQQFLEQTVAGVAQANQFQSSLQGIADTMGVQLPSGIRVTAEELQAAIYEMEQFGGSAITSADIINSRFGSAFKMVGDLVGKAIEGGKEFSKAWKDLDLSAVPKGQRGFFKDMIKDMADAQEKAQALSVGVNLVATAISQGALSGKQAGADIKKFGDELTKIAELDPRLTPIAITLKSFLDNIPAGQKLQGLRTFSDIWINDILPAFEDGVVTTSEINAIMEKLNNNIELQGNALEMTSKQWKKFSKDLDQAQKDANKAADSLNKIFPTLGLQDFTFGEDINKKNQKEKEFKKDTKSTEPTGIPGVTGRAPTEAELRAFLASQNQPKITPGDFGIKVGGGAGTTGGVKVGGGGAGTTTPVPDSKAVQVATDAINKALASSQTAFANFSIQGSNSMALLIAHLKAHITTLGTYFTKTIPVDVSVSNIAFQTMSLLSSQAVARLITVLKAHVTTIGTYFTKTIPVDVSVSTVAFQTMSVLSSQAMARLITTLKAHITTITTYFTKTIPVDLSVGWTAFQTMNQLSSQAMATLIATLKAHVTTITTYFTKTIPADLQTAADAFNQFMVDSSNSMATLIANIKPHMTTLGTYFTVTIPDYMKQATNAVKAFESAFTSSMGKVTDSANEATSAVNSLVAAVKKADGAKATVTVTTEFKTSGSPPSGGSKAGSSAHGLLSNVISAASPKSFAEGGIQTIQGPQLALFGDNPGGIETHAFIPHDNPFPILRKLAKMFNKNSRAGEIVDRALGKAEDMWIDLHLQIDNIMDGEKVSRQVLRKTFKKMRTRP